MEGVSVHFSEDTHLDPDVVHVENQGSKYHLPEAHIGMLRNHHTYHADIPVRYNLGGEHVTVDQPNYNLYVRVIDTQAPEKMEDGWYKIMVKIEIKTLKDGRIREKILLTNTEDTQKQMEVLVTAQVMDTNRGNPILKDGVHLVSHEIEDESDWPGHSH